ncbi:uncharacterized protein B0H18DRAFT_1085362 [Fomitopsis serialis]|uniref:uncharacterized protein n=1 Tax=Fomitopsis serialis TaxID=139415 RepID=UPI0020081E0C|nr:uncharacterized protein B0H18DRAFT_1085362 [Neoantrodia serialis]KAH9924874.1 hypothetical protein B0H18DRAFT_1085362 [Neoantrodia serialis]
MSTDPFAFTNKIALISGGGSGIGAYVTQGLAAAGNGTNRIYIVGRRVAALASTASSSTYASSIIPLPGDVGTIAGCRKIAVGFVEAEKRAGIAEDEIQLDLLVNNAGIARREGHASPEATVNELAESLLKASDDDWRDEMAVNVGSIQWLSACLLPYLVRAASSGKRDGRRSIVVNTSVSAFQPSQSIHLYCASKAGAHSVAQSLARERMPVGRIGEPEDVVAAVVYLASRSGSYVSGAVIGVSAS